MDLSSILNCNTFSVAPSITHENAKTRYSIGSIQNQPFGKWNRQAREYERGKYQCTIDLLFGMFGISCMTTNNFCFYLQNRLIQTSQTGGQWYPDTSPFSIPWVGFHCHQYSAIQMRKCVKTKIQTSHWKAHFWVHVCYRGHHLKGMQIF